MYVGHMKRWNGPEHVTHVKALFKSGVFGCVLLIKRSIVLWLFCEWNQGSCFNIFVVFEDLCVQREVLSLFDDRSEIFLERELT